MLQTGYLTFKRHIEDDIYEIGFPNKEVDDAFSKMLLGDYLESETSIAGNTVHDIQTAFKQNDTQLVIALLTNMFKILPSQFFWEDGEKRDKQGNVTIIKKQVNENFYHAIIYLIFNILSIRMKVEIPSSFGRIDAIVETDTHVYLFEFKKGRNADDAIQQIIENQYANLYSLSNKQIVLMGVCFTAAKRGISSSKILNLEEALDYRADLKLKI
jgi:tRNA(Glu) U13 pseudouridine synthase TruD